MGASIAAGLALVALSGCQLSAAAPRPPERPGSLLLELDPAQSRAGGSVLYLEQASDPRPRVTGAQRVTVVSEGPAFDPPLRVVRAGADLRFLNRGPLAHRLFIADDKGRRERSVDPGGQSELLRITRLGEHRFYCSLHPDEGFSVFASPSDYFVVTDGASSYRLDDLPPGSYHLTRWSDAGVHWIAAVEIRPGGTARQTISAGPAGP